MIGYVYRMNLPTLGIQTIEGKREPMIVPADAIITIVNGPLDGTRLVDVKWGDRPVMMFTRDIRERGTALESPHLPVTLCLMPCEECDRLQTKCREAIRAYAVIVGTLDKMADADRAVFNETIERLAVLRETSASARHDLNAHMSDVHDIPEQAG